MTTHDIAALISIKNMMNDKCEPINKDIHGIILGIFMKYRLLPYLGWHEYQ